MKTRHRILAGLLLFALAISMMGIGGVQAQERMPVGQNENSPEMCVYGKEGETTFVPAGYTYVYQEDGEPVYWETVEADTYISQRTLTSEEAEQLSRLEYTGTDSHTAHADGTVSVEREYNAKEAAAYSAAVQAILNGEEIPAASEDAVVRVRVDAYAPTQEVAAMIVFEDEAVAQMQTMRVRLGEAPGQAEQAAMKTIQTRQAAEIHAIQKALGHEVEVTEQFSLLTNAVAATVQYGDLPKINEMQGVKCAYVMPTFTIPEVNAETVTGAVEPNMKYAGPGMGSTIAWDLGYKGEGMSVAILDTGLDMDHPCFAIAPTDQNTLAYTKSDIQEILNSKLLHVEYLAENVTADSLYYSSKIPFGFDYGDSLANFGDDFTGQGHGTHVAGIVAGNMPELLQEQYEMETLGIAPEAQILVMKVFDQYGGGDFSHIVAAMEDAILLGVDCANLSLGAACGPCYLEGVTEVFDAAYQAGVNVTVSAGNDSFTGYNSLWGDNLVESSSVSTGTLGMPGTFDSVLTVASAENARYYDVYSGGNRLYWTDSDGSIGQIPYNNAPNLPAGKSLRAALNEQEWGWTASFENAKDKLVFAPFEGGDADSLVQQAKEAGAIGVAVYDPTPADFFEMYFNPVAFTVTDFDVPVVAIVPTNYDYFVSCNPAAVYIASAWTDSGMGGQMSAFSSWGPNESLSLKPEITGIGGNVFSAYAGGFATASGTSMSAPAVAATAALLRQYLKATDIAPQDYAHVVNCLLMSTATPIFDEANGTYYFVRRQGAGMANAGAAMNSGAYIQVKGANKAKLELGDDPQRTGVYEMTFQVVNFSGVDKTYTLDVTALGQKAEGGQIKDGEITYLVYDYARELDAAVASSAADGKVTVPAGSTAEVTVTLTLSESDRAYMDERFPYGSYLEGFIRLRSEESVSLTVPFLGFYGDFGEGPIFEEGTYDSLLSSEYGYNTADHFQNALWSYKSASVTPDRDPGDVAGDRLQDTQTKWYLGNSVDPLAQVIPAGLVEDYAQLSFVLPFLPDKAGISPNGDGNLDLLQMGLGLKRNAKQLKYTVTDRDTGEVLWEQTVEDVNKSYFSDNYGLMYCNYLDLHWLYPTYWEPDPMSGELVEYYDISRCLLEENTWVNIKAEAVSEYRGAAPNSNDTVEFSLYIDTGEPAPLSNYHVSANLGFMDDYPIINHRVFYDEDWFLDYSMSILSSWSEETKSWIGMLFTNTWERNAPGYYSNSGGSINTYFEHDKLKLLEFHYDYAGNVSAHSIDLNPKEGLLDLFQLQADKLEIEVGESLTITNTAEVPFQLSLNWTVTDPAIAQMIRSTGNTCTIQGVSPGKVKVLGGFGIHPDYTKYLEITVLDPNACRHTETELRGVKAATCTEEGYTGDLCCTACNAVVTPGQVIPVLPHTYQAVVTAPTCTEGGYTTYTCSVCGDSYAGDYVDALGHDFTATVVNPTCTEAGYTQHDCAACGYSFRDSFTQALGHDWSDWAVTKQATCDEAGQESRTCGHCGEVQTQAVLPTGHTYESEVVAPTCTAAGYTVYTCTCCGNRYMSDIVDPTGHTYKAVVTAPTCTEGGYTTYTCSVCGERYVDDYTPAHCPTAEYQDVPINAWFHGDVDYVVEKGLMQGVEKSVFAPQLATTRAQLVTVLYRMAGSPEAAPTAQFTDVPENSWYAKAVAWALENHITTGMSDDHFAPNDFVTRQQVVVFLARYAAHIGMDTKAEADWSAYRDGSRISPYAVDAMAWAVERGIITGMGDGVLNPTGECTRAQIAAILCRFCQMAQ